MTAPRRSLLQRQWHRAGWLSHLLWPLSALVEQAVKRKQRHYRTGVRVAWRAPVPVVVVGNIYVGGTGKTPVVIAVTHALQAAGLTVGVVSRGYGARAGAEPRVGQGTLAADLFGDEPALIAAATQAPVAVHPNRPSAVRALLAAYPSVQAIVSDDGLQHLALARDVELIVQDERGVGNGRLLPAGPLREPATRLLEADAVITNRTAPALVPAELDAANDSTTVRGVPSPRPGRRVDMTLQAGAIVRLVDGARMSLADLAASEPAKGIAACAGIGNPARFFATLERHGIPLVQRLALPDHFRYTESPFAKMDASIILITEKDAIKCVGFGDDRLWKVPVTPCFSDPDFLDWVVARVLALGAAHAL